MKELNIRPARLTDLDALLALETSSFTGDRLTRARLRHWITAPNGLLLVACGDNINTPALAGYALVMTRRNSRRARLYSIAIAAQARGKGLGQRLIEHCFDPLRAQGQQSLYLEVAAGNTRAITLYKRLGFTQFGIAEGYYDDGQDALRMQRPL